MRPRAKKRFDVHNVHITTLSRQSAKFANNKKKRAAFLSIFAVVSVLSWGYVISAGSHLDFWRIKSVTVEGSGKDIEPLLAAAAVHALDGDYLGFVSKANSLVYSKASIVAAVADASDRIEDVSVHRRGFRDLVVRVKEKDSVALICDDLPNFSAIENVAVSGGEGNDDRNCFFADLSGKIYMKAGSFSEKMFDSYFVTELEDGTPLQSALGRNFVASSTFQSLRNFYRGIKKGNVVPLGILVKGKGEYELYIENPAHRAGTEGTSTPVETMVVYFNEVNGFANELENFLSFWNHMYAAAQSRHEVLNFETIDLRFGSNVFYRRN